MFSRLRNRIWLLSELENGGELWLLVKVTAFAAAVPLLMRLPLPRMSALLTRPPRARQPAPGEVERLDRLVALAPRIGRPVVKSACLTRGVTLYWFLRRAGLDVELRFGLDPGGEQPADGHCWLALDGEPFLEQRDYRSRFTELYRMPLPLT